MVAVPYFDNAELKISDEVSSAESEAAIKMFLQLTPADRTADSRHVYAYYRDYYEIVGGQDWLDDLMGVPKEPTEIWNHVTPGEIFVERGRDGILYLTMEAECAWEEEHGLMLVWRGGERLTKVGGYDGHFTNSYAYGDDRLQDVVYAASDSKYTTRLSDEA